MTGNVFDDVLAVAFEDPDNEALADALEDVFADAPADSFRDSLAVNSFVGAFKDSFGIAPECFPAVAFGSFGDSFRDNNSFVDGLKDSSSTGPEDSFTVALVDSTGPTLEDFNDRSLERFLESSPGDSTMISFEGSSVGSLTGSLESSSEGSSKVSFMSSSDGSSEGSFGDLESVASTRGFFVRNLSMLIWRSKVRFDDEKVVILAANFERLTCSPVASGLETVAVEKDCVRRGFGAGFSLLRSLECLYEEFIFVFEFHFDFLASFATKVCVETKNMLLEN